MSKFSETIRQYGATLKLIAADSVWRFKKESFFILLTGFLGTSFQLLTIGLALYYAHTLEKGGIIKLLGTRIPGADFDGAPFPFRNGRLALAFAVRRLNLLFKNKDHRIDAEI